MTMFRPSTILIALVAVVSACGPRLSSQDDEQDDPALEDLPSTVDLPCGGADLTTDNANCGVCGNECILLFEGTQLEAGGCVDGECGPNWSGCLGDPGIPTCADICEHYDGATCIPQGCAGLSGLMVAVPWFGGCDVLEDAITPILSCDEELEYLEDDETQGNVKCCCSSS